MSFPFAPLPSACIFGIDPGVTGAIAFLDTQDWKLGVMDMPTIEVTTNGKDHREPSPNVIASLIREIKPILVCSEKLQSIGKEINPLDLAKMGRWRGQIEGIVAHAQVAFEHPTPAVWKNRMGLTAVKEFSRTRAAALFPNCKGFWTRKMDHDRAEAACIALYGCLSLGIVPTKPIMPMVLAPKASEIDDDED